ncbi:unnamed protein product [Orchesella dallaii]|uniref:Glycoprotein n=1 Tax=Orchesella dallaii TaxID=48710 RepID=A0ABP1RL29_9HEXA
MKYIHRTEVILIGIIIRLLLRVNAAHDTDESDPSINTHSLFRDFEEKNTSLWKCDGWHGGMKWRIPNNLDCSLSTEFEETKVVAITIYWTDISKQTAQGYECYAERVSGWIYRNFWEAMTKETKTYRVHVTQETCWNMVRLNRAPDGRNLKEKAGVHGTFETLSIKSSWWSNSSASVINYYFLPLKIAVLELDSSIQSVTIFKKPCMYIESFCLTELGILVWDVKDIKTCRLREGENTRCLYSKGDTGNRLTCPELELSLHDLQHVQLCNQTFGTSSQGIYFAQNTLGEYDDIIVTQKEIRTLVSSPKARSRRAAKYNEASAQDAFINAKFNYLYEVVGKNTKHAIQKVMQEVCKANQRTLDTVRYMAETGHPTLITRYVFGDSSYKAAFAGDIVTIWQCTEIQRYKFLLREECMLEWPVSYIHNGIIMEGFVVPLSHTIISIPTRRPVPCMEFYFDTGHVVYHLSNEGATVVHLPTLPKPGDDHKELKYFPDLSFKSGSGFDITELTDVGHTYSLLRDAQARANHLKSIETKIEELSEPLTPIHFLWTSFITTLSGFPYLIKCIIGVVSACGAVATAMMLGLNLAVLTNLAHAAKAPFTLLFSLCKRSKAKLKKIMKSKRKHHVRDNVNDGFLEDYDLRYMHGINHHLPSAPPLDSFHVGSENTSATKKFRKVGHKKHY